MFNTKRKELSYIEFNVIASHFQFILLVYIHPRLLQNYLIYTHLSDNVYSLSFQN